LASLTIIFDCKLGSGVSIDEIGTENEEEKVVRKILFQADAIKDLIFE
jgi:hypothetical protein